MHPNNLSNLQTKLKNENTSDESKGLSQKQLGELEDPGRLGEQEPGKNFNDVMDGYKVTMNSGPLLRLLCTAQVAEKRRARRQGETKDHSRNLFRENDALGSQYE
jgi:hypothetical protein